MPLSSFNLLPLSRGGLRRLFAVVLAAALGAAGPLSAATAPAAPEAGYRLPDDPAELLRLDEGMRAFFDARVHRRVPMENRLDEIVAAILGPAGLHFRYEAAGVYDVREAFRRRAGNCVTYAMLFVAVAREYRIPAEFNEVRVLSRWSRVGGLVIESRHLNVWVGAAGGGYEIDLKLADDLRARRTGSQVVADARAFACTYTNAGVYRLAAGDRAGALALLERAVATDATCAHAWANLGGARLLGGAPERARSCYERALALDPAALAAVSALARIHREAGRMTEAAGYERRALRYRERNPYYLLGRAREDLASGRCEEARRRLARAIDLKDDEPEFYLAMVEVARRRGGEREAAPWVRRLDRFGPGLATMAAVAP